MVTQVAREKIVRASSDEPCNRAGSISGTNSVHMGNFSPVTEMNKTRPFKFHPG